MATPDLKNSDIELLEREIDTMESELPILKNFILPGGHPTVSYCNVARTVCRRAERTVVALDFEQSILPIIVQYLNRLSDYLFVLGRKLGQDLSVEEVIWNARK
jgi:cob(I)alamin adenosyltransferase